MIDSALQLARENYNTLVVLIGVSLLGASSGMIGAFAVLRKRALTGVEKGVEKGISLLCRKPAASG